MMVSLAVGGRAARTPKVVGLACCWGSIGRPTKIPSSVLLLFSTLYYCKSNLKVKSKGCWCKFITDDMRFRNVFEAALIATPSFGLGYTAEQCVPRSLFDETVQRHELAMQDLRKELSDNIRALRWIIAGDRGGPREEEPGVASAATSQRHLLSLQSGKPTRIDQGSVATKSMETAQLNITGDIYISGTIYWHGLPVGFNMPSLAPTLAPTAQPTVSELNKYIVPGKSRLVALNFNDDGSIDAQTSPSSLPCTAYGSLPRTAGGLTPGGSFAGPFSSSDYLQCPDKTLESIGGTGRSWLTWYKGTSLASSSSAWGCGVQVFGDPRNSVYIAAGVDSGMLAVGNNGPVNGNYLGTTNVADGAWHLLAFTFDGTTFKGFTNNGCTVSEEISFASVQYIEHCRLDYIGKGYPYDGTVNPESLDGVQIYEGALNLAEVQAVFDAGSTHVLSC